MEMLAKHKAIILAAGEGTRLRPYTINRPKCLVDIDGVSLLDRQLSVLMKGGVDPVILIGGYCIDKIMGRHLEVRQNPRYAETNMLWTLFCAEDDLEGGAIVSYGDIVYSLKNLQSLIQSEADIAVVVDMEWESYWRARNENPLDDAETLKLSSDGGITEIGQRPKSLLEIEAQYIGLMKFSAKGMQILRQHYLEAKLLGSLDGKSLEKAYMTDMLQHLINSGVRIDAVKIYGGWVEVDTTQDLENQITKIRIAEIADALNK